MSKMYSSWYIPSPPAGEARDEGDLASTSHVVGPARAAYTSLMGRRHGSWFGRSSALLLLAFSMVVAAAPMLHHDVDCHINSPTHCTGCTLSLSAPAVGGRTPILGGAATADAVSLAELGARPHRRPGTRMSGRAPPSLL